MPPQTTIVISEGADFVLAYEDVETVRAMVSSGQPFVVRTDSGPRHLTPGEVVRVEPAGS